MRLAILGRTHWLINAAQRCAAAGHDIVLVATASAAPESTANESDFEHLARQNGASFHLNPNVNETGFIRALAESRAQAGVSINWPTLMGADACAAVPFGILNAHAGDLPRYRGNACPNWAIINGEPHVGVCVHAMDPTQVDAGPVYARRRLPLDARVYINDVYLWLDQVIPEMFVEALANAETSGFEPEDQAASSVVPLRCHRRRPEDGRIDWRDAAVRIARLVRASSRPFAGAFSFLEGKTKVTIWRACEASLHHQVVAVPGQVIGRGRSGCVLVACGQGILEIEEATMEDGSRLPAANRFRLQS
jgi:methionyl-tRNA formyltransferase